MSLLKIFIKPMRKDTIPAKTGTGIRFQELGCVENSNTCEKKHVDKNAVFVVYRYKELRFFLWLRGRKKHSQFVCHTTFRGNVYR
jgi:hypothetical protein